MQYIAEDPLHVVVRSEIPALYDNQGRMLSPSRRRLFAKFTRGVAPQWATAIALDTFEFARKQEGVTREQWVAFYDSVQDQGSMGWTDEERETIEQKLATRPGVIQLERPRLLPPWPAYDRLVAVGRRTEEMVGQKVAETVAELGLNPAEVLAYERENAARYDVLMALQALVDQPEEEEEQEAELVIQA